MKYSLCIEMFYKGSGFKQKIDRAAMDGFDYIEFWRWSDKNWNSIESMLADDRPKISAFSGDDEFSMINPVEKEMYLSFLRESIGKAVAIGSPNLVIHSDALDPETGSAKKIETVLSFESRLFNMFEPKIPQKLVTRNQKCKHSEYPVKPGGGNQQRKERKSCCSGYMKISFLGKFASLNLSFFPRPLVVPTFFQLAAL